MVDTPTKKEVVAKLIASTYQSKVTTELEERFLKRGYSGGDNKTAQRLAQLQQQRKDLDAYLAFLEEAFNKEKMKDPEEARYLDQ